MAEQTEGVVVRIDIPPDHHPDLIRGESPGAALGRETLTRLYDAYGKINDVAKQVTDKGRLAAAAQPFAERAVHTAGANINRLRQQVEHLDAEIGRALAPPVEPQLASQIRAHWAQQGSEKITGLGRAIKEGDITTTAAVLCAPAYLSGLTADNQAMLRMMAAQRFAPEQVQARAEAADALERADRATRHFMTKMAASIREWSDKDQRVIEEGLR